MGSELTLLPGKRLGPYLIRGRVGSGGFGTVYRAHDTRLGRDVAIKLLRPEVQHSPARLRGLLDEARIQGRLTHPNVLAVYDVGEASGQPYVVTELLSGETLRQRLRREVHLTVGEALDVARQVAAGLDAAHAHGIAHLDLKPDNIFCRDDGVVKILDFGISRLTRTDVAAEETLPSDSEGGVNATPAYAAPEQLRGVTGHEKQSDVFSLGVVLFEMLCGRRPFERPSRVDELAAILHQDPPRLSSHVQVAPALEVLIARCLAKRPADRFQSAHDLAIAIDTVEAGRRQKRSWRVHVYWSVAALVLLGLLVPGSITERPGSDGTDAPRRPRLVTSLPGPELQPALSPLGDRVAYQRPDARGQQDIYVKLVDTASTIRLTEDPGVDCCPAWSPEAQQIAFLRSAGERARIYVVPSLGGAERMLLETSVWFGSGLSWSPDGRQLAFSAPEADGEPASIQLLSIDSSHVTCLTRPPADSVGDAFPVFSRDGRHLAFARLQGGADLLTAADVFVVPPEGGRPRRLTGHGRFIGGLAWSSREDALVFWGGGQGEVELLSASLRGRLRALGPVLPFDAVESIREPGRAFRISSSAATHRLAYAEARFDLNLWGLDLAGRSPPTRRIASTRNDSAPSYSPDGASVTFSSDRDRARGETEIWLCREDGVDCRALTRLRTHSGTPRWSPDGRWIAFDSRPEGNGDILVIEFDSGRIHRLTSDPAEDVVPGWSADSANVYFASNRDGSWQVWKAPVGGGAPARVTNAGGFSSQESSNGEWLLHARVNAPGIWRIPTSGGAPAERIVDGLRCWGNWTVNGEWVYYVDDSSPRPRLERWRPGSGAELVRELEHRPSCGEAGLAVSPDGTRAILALNDLTEGDIVLIDEPG